ncbi:putative surface lipoprotein [Aquimarina sp. MAR_2010_214]|uniref:Lipl32 family lipoprotein n=1 Tax=Aquimarina sp. MAR_2010_214 TaxID=1250026 RepID=UPI000C70E9E0|nr:Lipl32 family lipoprotein [Aquimarina sp. MAR_2010_214]PKV49883.1 putative surface lipoprotein [Aquimarina sp. MAR_2010_214]
MKTKILILLSIFALGTSVDAQAQKLKKFGGLTEKKIGPKTIKVPYTDIVTYLGYAAPGNEDEVKDGKKFYYIYVWVPAVAPELGIRMMSPVGKNKVKGATQSAAYTENAGSSDFFDTYITLERSDIISKDKISAEAAKSANWTVLERNDDSSEMPKQPSGSSYNSLLRYKSEVGDPLKALTAGLYRIGFTTYKTGEVKGTFLAQVAAPIKLPGVVMAKTIEELKKGL